MTSTPSFFKNIYICYSPLHIFSSLILSKDSPQSTIIIAPEKYRLLCPKIGKFISMKYGGSEIGSLKKLIFFLINFATLHHRYPINSLTIPNDADPFIMLLVKRLNWSELIYMDEGLTLLHHENMDKRTFHVSKSTKLKEFFGLEINAIPMTSASYSKGYVFFAEQLSRFSRLPLFELNTLFLNESLDIEGIDQMVYPNSPDFLILGQPLGIDGHCSKNQEYSAINKFIEYFPSAEVVYKPHYRENVQDYSFLKKYKNVQVLDVNKIIPYQIIHAKIDPKNIVSFISSALFSVPSLHEDFHRISLIDLIDAPKMKTYEHTFNALKIKFPDFRYFRDL